jgi:hypothetical protein
MTTWSLTTSPIACMMWDQFRLFSLVFTHMLKSVSAYCLTCRRKTSDLIVSILILLVESIDIISQAEQDPLSEMLYRLRRPSLQSSGNSYSDCSHRRSGFDFRNNQTFLEVLGLERGPINIMTIN